MPERQPPHDDIAGQLVAERQRRETLEAALRESEARYRALASKRGSREAATLRAIREAVVTVDADGRVESLNPAAETLLVWSARNARGRSADDVMRLISSKTGGALVNPVYRSLRTGRRVTATGNSLLVQPCGTSVPVRVRAAPVRDASGEVRGAVVVVKDKSAEMVLQAKLDHQARHDGLTGLANRAVFERRLDEALQDIGGNTDVSHAMLYIDLDQFKVINDTCGHAVGDALVRRVADLLGKHVRASDVLARLGGDEFGLLLLGCPAERAAHIAEQLCTGIRELRFEWEDRAYQHTASIGVVMVDASSESAAAVLSAADVACFAAKDEGRNRVHVYRAEEVPGHHIEMQWVARINRACDENRLRVYQQPIVPIGHNRDRCGHYELLLRMTDREGRIVLPEAFIPAAERYNLMPTIDRWMVRHALSELAHRSDGRHSRGLYTLSINLSGTSLSDEDFLEFVRSEMVRRGPTPGAICFEITETAAIANIATVAHFMRELKKLGCLFSLDDFGSGLSSLAYLKDLPVDFLKIDGQFVRNICEDPIDHAMVAAIHQIGHAMGIKTVAERVESAAAVSSLSAIGIDYAQGFYFARPDAVASRDAFRDAGYAWNRQVV